MLRRERSEGEGHVELDVHEPSDDEPLLKDQQKRTAASAPTKILFLDGIRGLAAIFVVLQHSTEYVNDVNLGASAVDAFFVLSSFLLTMLFLKKSEKLAAQGAGVRQWAFALADYFMKRFFRVYPFFALVAVVLWLLPFDDQKRYFLVETADKHDLFKVLTFDTEHRYLMLWTLPLEIAYYFFIPVFVLAVVKLRRLWWVPLAPLQLWIIHDNLYTLRSHHMPLRAHVSTFLQGSIAAVVFVKLEAWQKSSRLGLSKWHTTLIRVAEGFLLVLLISESFQALLYRWWHDTFVPASPGDPFISLLLSSLIVIELVSPSAVSTTLEWNVLRYWGKMSFSVYLLHPFVIFSDVISQQTNYFDRLFERTFLLLALGSVSFYAVEYPLQLVVRRLSRRLAQLEAKGPRCIGSESHSSIAEFA